MNGAQLEPLVHHLSSEILRMREEEKELPVIHVLWDASARAKRYGAEVGSQTVNALFARRVPPTDRAATVIHCNRLQCITVRQPLQSRGSTAW